MDKNDCFERIPSELTERGDIKKCVVTSLKEFESIFSKDSKLQKYVEKLLESGYVLEALKVAPYAIVKHHIHTDTWEIRINLKQNVIVDFYEIGEMHERLKNNTNEPMLLFCIKGTKGKAPIEDIQKALTR